MKIFLQFFIITAVSSVFGQNLNFENWTGANPDPAGWYCWNSPNSPYIFITKSTDVCNGNFSLKSEVVLSQQSGTYVCSPLQTGTVSTNSYIPISVKPNELRGCYKFNRPGSSAAIFSVSVKFKKNGNVIGSGTFTNSTNYSSYQTFIANITYTPALTPDSVSIKLDLGLTNPLTVSEMGAYFIVDSLSFQNINSVSELGNDLNLSIYPNPGRDKIFVDGIGIGSNAHYMISDLAGKMMMRGELKEEKVIYLPEMEDGMYILRINQNSRPAISKMLLYQK